MYFWGRMKIIFFRLLRCLWMTLLVPQRLPSTLRFNAIVGYLSVRKRYRHYERKELPKSCLEHVPLGIFKVQCKIIHAEHVVCERHSMH